LSFLATNKRSRVTKRKTPKPSSQSYLNREYVRLEEAERQLRLRNRRRPAKITPANLAYLIEEEKEDDTDNIRDAFVLDSEDQESLTPSQEDDDEADNMLLDPRELMLLVPVGYFEAIQARIDLFNSLAQA
jgi:hypothetical protein